MNTFFLKVGCLCLFTFIFFLSFQTKNEVNQLSSHSSKDLLEQEPATISDNISFNIQDNLELENTFYN